MPGRELCTAAATRPGPIAMVPEVQPKAITSSRSSGTMSPTARGMCASMSRSPCGVSSSISGMRLANTAAPSNGARKARSSRSITTSLLSAMSPIAAARAGPSSSSQGMVSQECRVSTVAAIGLLRPLLLADVPERDHVCLEQAGQVLAPGEGLAVLADGDHRERLPEPRVQGFERLALGHLVRRRDIGAAEPLGLLVA